MYNIATKRMMKDIALMQQDKIENIKAYFHEDNIFCVDLLIIPKTSPYKNGLYFVRLNFDKKNHPFKPPIATFYSCVNNIRFHPNLYDNGKVCLSILNTWQGPAWSACQTINSIALSLSLLFDEYPLRHEPSFENSTHESVYRYNEIIHFYNLYNTIRCVSLTKQRNNQTDTQLILAHFADDIIKFWDENQSSIINTIQENIDINKEIMCGTYHMKARINYNKLMRLIEEL